MPQLRASAEIEPGLMACLSETRIGLFDFSEATCTEPLSFVSGSSHRASVDSCREVTTDLDLYTQADPIGIRHVTNLFAYANENPLFHTDARGLMVQKCCGPAHATLTRPHHCWLKTASNEGGMGPIGGEGGPSYYGCPTQVVASPGRYRETGVTCTDFPNVDEPCVGRAIAVDKNGLGAGTGRWGVTNNCGTFADAVLSHCAPIPFCPSFRDTTLPMIIKILGDQLKQSIPLSHGR